MGFATGLASAKKPTGKGEYIVPGNFIFQVDYLKENVGGYKGDSFVAAFKTIDSDTPEQKIGGCPAWVSVKRPDNAAMAQGEVKEFLSILMNLEYDDIDEEVFENLVGTDQPAAGHYIRCYAWEKPTKNGGMWTAMKWEYIGEELGDHHVENSIRGEAAA